MTDLNTGDGAAAGACGGVDKDVVDAAGRGEVVQVLLVHALELELAARHAVARVGVGQHRELVLGAQHRRGRRLRALGLQCRARA